MTLAWMIVLMLTQPSGLTTLERGTRSNVEAPIEVVVRSDADWSAPWKLHGGRGAAPTVDFSREMILGVFLGTRPTGGFRAEILSARIDGGTLIIDCVEQKPGAGDIMSQALTSPFHIVRLARYEGPTNPFTPEARSV